MCKVFGCSVMRFALRNVAFLNALWTFKQKKNFVMEVELFWNSYSYFFQIGINQINRYFKETLSLFLCFQNTNNLRCEISPRSFYTCLTCAIHRCRTRNKMLFRAANLLMIRHIKVSQWLHLLFLLFHANHKKDKASLKTKLSACFLYAQRKSPLSTGC